MNAPTLLCIAALGLGLGWNEPQEPEVTSTRVAGDIHMLAGQGGNVGLLLGSDGVLMIDDQYPHMVQALRKEIEELGGSAPRFLINTHWHGDHVGGNAEFGKHALILAHDLVRTRMAKGRPGQPPAPAQALPTVTYDDRVSLHFNGEEVRLLAFPPGHTDGDSMVWFPQSKVLHMGDHFFSGMFPFIDLDSGGDVVGYITNIESVLEWLPSDAQIIPGHGPLSTVKELKESLSMLHQTTAIVRARIAAGMSAEQCVAAGLPDTWASWSWQFINTERWLSILYQSLSTKDKAQGR